VTETTLVREERNKREGKRERTRPSVFRGLLMRGENIEVQRETTREETTSREPNPIVVGSKSHSDFPQLEMMWLTLA
jgi:hypothetical protein